MQKRKLFLILAVIITISLIGLSAQCGIGITGGAPTIELGIYEGPYYSESNNMCYYRVAVKVTGSTDMEIEFKDDDNVKLLSYVSAEVGVKAGDTYNLTVTATNSEGTATTSLILKGECIIGGIAENDAGNDIDSGSAQGNEELEIIKKAPIFELINQDNEEISLNQFPEKVKLLSFFYTDCTEEDACSLTTISFQKVQGLLGEELGKKTVLFLISINPENDVPEVLREYGEIYGIDYSNLHFLTGDKLVVEKVLEDYEIFAEKLEDEGEVSNAGLLTPVIAFSGINLVHGDEDLEIVHTLVTFLIDQDNNIRQLYYSNFWLPEDVKKDIITLIDD